MVPPRKTDTGAVLEAMVLPSLERGGYLHKTQVNVGTRPGGGKHKIDVLAEKDGKEHLVSLKWQQVSGTAEQKVPYEVMSLIDADIEGSYAGVYLVLGGDGWKLRDFYLSEEFKMYLKHGERVTIITLEGFVALANDGKL